jgi:hypothetical protein
MKKKRTKKALIKTISHIAYEIQIFHYAYISYSQPNVNKNDLLRSIFIEAFVLHARNLYDFFYRRKNKTPRDDDVIVEDFLSNKNMKIFKKNRTNKTEMDRVFSITRANKEIAHLSYYRLRKTAKTKQWKIPKIYNGMHKTIHAFLNLIDDKQKKEILKLPYLNLFVYNPKPLLNRFK